VLVGFFGFSACVKKTTALRIEVNVMYQYNAALCSRVNESSRHGRSQAGTLHFGTGVL